MWQQHEASSVSNVHACSFLDDHTIHITVWRRAHAVVNDQIGSELTGMAGNLIIVVETKRSITFTSFDPQRKPGHDLRSTCETFGRDHEDNDTTEQQSGWKDFELLPMHKITYKCFFPRSWSYLSVACIQLSLCKNITITAVFQTQLGWVVRLYFL